MIADHAIAIALGKAEHFASITGTYGKRFQNGNDRSTGPVAPANS
jgi:hypothetical protein